MKPCKITRLFKGNVQGSSGAYSGMFDLLFTANGTELPLMKYREHPTHPWLPEASHGASVFAEMPQNPPKLQKIKPYSEWAMEGTKCVKDTILLCMDYARSLDGHGMAKAIALKTWQSHYEILKGRH